MGIANEPSELQAAWRGDLMNKRTKIWPFPKTITIEEWVRRRTPDGYLVIELYYGIPDLGKSGLLCTTLAEPNAVTAKRRLIQGAEEWAGHYRMKALEHSDGRV